MMRKNFKALQAKMSPAARARAEVKAEALIRAMSLEELREAVSLTQEELAGRLGVRQPAVAKLERRADVRVRTLQGVVYAMGGRLEVRALFPQGPVVLEQFSGPPTRKVQAGAG